MRSVLLAFVTVVFAGISVGEDAKPKNALEENVLLLFTKWRAGERGPFSFPLPSLDVISMPSTNGDYEGYGVRIKYSTSNLFVIGLKRFSVEQIDISGSKLTASGVFIVPSISVISDKYSVNGRALWFIPIKGSGTMNITIKNIQLNISITLINNSSRMWVDSSNLSFKISSVNANLENAPNTITVLLNKSGATILKSYHNDIVKAVQNVMVPAMDSFLDGNRIVTPDQLFRLLEEEKTPPPTVVLVE
ncbi:unnamed protein product [Chilo suppressalis]|uniref:Uncharacterized protein n=1 Tax=Chilo suppressalis TaxID=168631 RepID=A0ABN8BFA3_CHISP|nr:hypothetical protein evm_005928 [Chilo suppressalis]CAH0406049.1 unnamed protein product [Chilo suppressalis]